MDFLQIDVFAGTAYAGNPLAVFPDAGDLSPGQMQAIASEMNLSETTFVTDVRDDSYDVRIFTPTTELPFAGHPTLGTAWTLRHLGKLNADRVTQLSRAGETVVVLKDRRAELTRTGKAERDLELTDPPALRKIAAALSVTPDAIGLEARELGRSGRLRPAFSDAGLRQLFVPVRSIPDLESCRVVANLLDALAPVGVYCFTASGAGRVRARGLFPSAGVNEDPATGSAAAGLGLYLADRLGDIDLEVLQGQEIGRPSHLFVKGRTGEVRVAGDCVLIFEGRLTELPQR
jgi:trans-2,3-dihydro-3-hydroxyanthranilate isomerase